MRAATLLSLIFSSANALAGDCSYSYGKTTDIFISARDVPGLRANLILHSKGLHHQKSDAEFFISLIRQYQSGEDNEGYVSLSVIRNQDKKVVFGIDEKAFTASTLLKQVPNCEVLHATP